MTLPLEHEDIIRQQAERFDIDPALIAAVIDEESGFSDQTSSAGARGLMQITHATADTIETLSGGQTFVYDDLANPGPQHPLRDLLPQPPARPLRRQRGRRARRLQRRPGERRASGAASDLQIDDIPFPETRAYVEDVLEKQQQYRDNYADELGLQ